MNRDHAPHATYKCTNEWLEEAFNVMKKKGNFNKKRPTNYEIYILKFLNFQPYKWQNQNLESWLIKYVKEEDVIIIT
jgi:hypothetical protein